MLFQSLALSCTFSTVLAAGLGESSLEKFVDSLTLDYSFGPVKEAYWTGYPHHRRTPFAVSPDGSSAYLAYLDSSETDVHVQQVNPSTFVAEGSAVTISGAKEAGGLVAHNDGFALLTNEALPSGTTDAPADSTPVPVIYRYTNGEQTWKTFVGGPGVDADFGLAASPDLNGDLVYSEKAEMYGAYFVITDYTGDASGHYGDSHKYVTSNGSLTTISGASASWGCSHNTGIAFEAADEAPFASICAEDQGDIWLNTKTLTMDGVKISNENTTNGASGEPMGGTSGSYSSLARLIDSDSYVFAWVSRGAIDLYENSWMGSGYTSCLNRTNGRNVAIAQFTDKNTLDGQEASSTVGATDGDSQVNWITSGDADCSNTHVAAFDGESVLVTWEEIENPDCPYIAMGCKGTFTGSRFQLVTSGSKVGDPIVETDTYVAGDMVTMSDGRICWPYVNMEWSLSDAVAYGGSTATTKTMSFACMSLNGTSSSSNSTTSTGSSSSTAAASTAAAAPSTASTNEAAAAASSSSSTLATSVRTSDAAPVTTASASDDTEPEPATATTTDAAAAFPTAVDTASYQAPAATASAAPSGFGGFGQGWGSSGDENGGFGGFGTGRKTSCSSRRRRV